MAELVDGHVSVNQCRRAVMALMEYALSARAARKARRERTASRKGGEYLAPDCGKEIHGEVKLKPHRMCVNASISYKAYML